MNLDLAVAKGAKMPMFLWTSRIRRYQDTTVRVVMFISFSWRYKNDFIEPKKQATPTSLQQRTEWLWLWLCPWLVTECFLSACLIVSHQEPDSYSSNSGFSNWWLAGEHPINIRRLHQLISMQIVSYFWVSDTVS